jgi:peroxiredoxin
VAAQSEAGAAAAAVGSTAPAAQLTATSGTRLALADALHQHARTVVVFYRGFW